MGVDIKMKKKTYTELEFKLMFVVGFFIGLTTGLLTLIMIWGGIK